MLRKWSQTEIEKLYELYPTHTITSLASILNRSWASVQLKINKMGLKKYNKQEWNVLDKDTLYLDYQGQRILIDSDDLDKVSPHRWRIGKTNTGQYVQGSICNQYKRRTILIHSLICPAPKGMVTDHKNGNTLDNRKENLRVATHRQNHANSKSKSRTTSYKGYTWDISRKKWVSRIKINEKQHILGAFETEEQAAKAYDTKALEIYGAFARLNFPALPNQDKEE